jgi:cell wall-associated NlpC family hydrolase
VASVTFGGNVNADAAVSRYYLDRDTSWYAARMLGYPYQYGGSGPQAFDCSGLAQYVYGHYGYWIPRTADEQYRYFRQIPRWYAWGGDLVFFHVWPGGPVYHTGIYEGGGNMVSALNYAYGVKWTPVSWGGPYVTYGTISH